MENSIPPREDSEKGGITRTIYYAKAGRSETGGNLDLELVPTVAEGNTLALLFYGVPLAKTEVTVIGPPKWEKHLTTDDQGRIDMPTLWSGRYVLEVSHFEAKPGGSENGKFDRTRHITSLSFCATGWAGVVSQTLTRQGLVQVIVQQKMKEIRKIVS